MAVPALGAVKSWKACSNRSAAPLIVCVNGPDGPGVGAGVGDGAGAGVGDGAGAGGAGVGDVGEEGEVGEGELLLPHAAAPTLRRTTNTMTDFFIGFSRRRVAAPGRECRRWPAPSASSAGSVTAPTAPSEVSI